MNFRRVLFRLWIIFALCFAVLVVALFFEDLRVQVGINSLTHPGEFDPDAYLAGRSQPNAWVLLFTVAKFAMGVPIAVLGIGAALLWAAEGFRKDERRRNQGTSKKRMTFSKVLRGFGITVAALLVIGSGLVLITDPLPLRISDPDEVALSVPPPPKLDGLQHSIDVGVACHWKLGGYTSSFGGRPIITVVDWFKHSTVDYAAHPESDVHLLAAKGTKASWAFRLDRAANTLCYQQPNLVGAGVTDAYCGLTLRYRASKRDCNVCAFKMQCCPHTPARQIPRDLHEDARDVARALAKTEAFEQSRRERKKVEMRFAHMKRIFKLDRLRLRGLSGAKDEVLLTATAQNLRRLVKFLCRPPPSAAITCAA
jgi:hypothetical protein